MTSLMTSLDNHIQKNERKIKNRMTKDNCKKFDHGKSRMSLIPFTALRALGDVYTIGAQKYNDNNWLKGTKWSRLQDAMLRHYERFAAGEDTDEETGLLHTAQMTWNAIGLLTYQLLNIGEDDRWKERADFVPKDLEIANEKSFAELDPDKEGVAK